jgi:hypothetical protein
VKVLPEVVATEREPASDGHTLIYEREAYTKLKISESTIKRMRKNGEILFEKIGPAKKLVRLLCQKRRKQNATTRQSAGD